MSDAMNFSQNLTTLDKIQPVIVKTVMENFEFALNHCTTTGQPYISPDVEILMSTDLRNMVAMEKTGKGESREIESYDDKVPIQSWRKFV